MRKHWTVAAIVLSMTATVSIGQPYTPFPSVLPSPVPPSPQGPSPSSPVLPGGPGPSSPLYNLPAGSPGIPGTPQSRYPGSPAGAATGVVPGVPVPGETTSAEPPAHRHARASTHYHGLAAHPPSQMTGTNADQLNQEELARLQAGNFSMPPAPPAPEQQ
jgi:hypothetical protein